MPAWVGESRVLFGDSEVVLLVLLMDDDQHDQVKRAGRSRESERESSARDPRPTSARKERNSKAEGRTAHTGVHVCWCVVVRAAATTRSRGQARRRRRGSLKLLLQLCGYVLSWRAACTLPVANARVSHGRTPGTRWIRARATPSL